jgi:hypothetical protein
MCNDDIYVALLLGSLPHGYTDYTHRCEALAESITGTDLRINNRHYLSQCVCVCVCLCVCVGGGGELLSVGYCMIKYSKAPCSQLFSSFLRTLNRWLKKKTESHVV